MKHLFNFVTWLVLALAAPLAAAQSDIIKASSWLGHYVVTNDGDELGKIEDIAIDQADGSVAYVVVSIASFLIDDSLIAVHPDALLTQPGSTDLVLHTDQDLQSVERFTDDRWPARAAVLPAHGAPQIRTAEDRPSSDPASATPDVATGTATITGLTKTATLSAGERRITSIQLPIATPTIAIVPYDGPPTDFDRLDRDGNGILSRREIAHQLTNRDTYKEVDGDDNGVVDRFEFDVLIERQEQNSL